MINLDGNSSRSVIKTYLLHWISQIIHLKYTYSSWRHQQKHICHHIWQKRTRRKYFCTCSQYRTRWWLNTTFGAGLDRALQWQSPALRPLVLQLVLANNITTNEASYSPQITTRCSACIAFAALWKKSYGMMTSSNGDIFRVTGHLCGEFTGPRWILHTKASDAELWCLLWSAPE